MGDYVPGCDVRRLGVVVAWRVLHEVAAAADCDMGLRLTNPRNRRLSFVDCPPGVHPGGRIRE
jgi:hypothetical protein